MTALVRVGQYSGVAAPTGAPQSLLECPSSQERGSSTTKLHHALPHQGVRMQGGTDEAVKAAVAGGHL